MPTIVGIAGSLRRGSYNAALLRAAKQFTPEGSTIEVESIAEFPLYNADVQEEQGFPPPVERLKERLAEADGLLLVTPEYNLSIPGVMKNAIDWLSRPASGIPHVFGDLPTGLIGAGGRSGTRFAQAAWLPVLRTLRTRPWFGASLYASGSSEVFDEDGLLVDETVTDLLQRYVEGFSEFCASVPRRRPS